jgi:4-diphosphocytidyl-2-C-methyl-D-erythritol kinase
VEREVKTRSEPVALRIPSFAKVNLGLEVLGRRRDGYHELRTIFQTIDLHDDVVLRRAQGLSVKCDHPGVPEGAANLALRAARLLRPYAGPRRGVEITITKRIPVSGGLGGGSSNAAAVLIGLDRLWRLGLGTAKLHGIARRLGADVPFFLVGGTALGLARGDEVYPLRRQVRGHVVVVDTGRPVSTAAVFRRADRSLTARENGYTIFRFVSSDLEGDAGYRLLTNDLEKLALEEAPELQRPAKRIRSILARGGARLVSLSGSGSSFFGLYDEARKARHAQRDLAAEGFTAFRGRTLSLERYRGILSEALGRRGAVVEWTR